MFAISYKPDFIEKTEIRYSQGIQIDIQSFIEFYSIYLKYPLEDHYFFLTLFVDK